MNFKTIAVTLLLLSPFTHASNPDEDQGDILAAPAPQVVTEINSSEDRDQFLEDVKDLPADNEPLHLSVKTLYFSEEFSKLTGLNIASFTLVGYCSAFGEENLFNTFLNNNTVTALTISYLDVDASFLRACARNPSLETFSMRELQFQSPSIRWVPWKHPEGYRNQYKDGEKSGLLTLLREARDRVRAAPHGTMINAADLLPGLTQSIAHVNDELIPTLHFIGTLFLGAQPWGRFKKTWRTITQEPVAKTSDLLDLYNALVTHYSDTGYQDRLARYYDQQTLSLFLEKLAVTKGVSWHSQEPEEVQGHFVDFLERNKNHIKFLNLSYSHFSTDHWEKIINLLPDMENLRTFKAHHNNLWRGQTMKLVDSLVSLGNTYQKLLRIDMEPAWLYSNVQGALNGSAGLAFPLVLAIAPLADLAGAQGLDYMNTLCKLCSIKHRVHINLYQNSEMKRSQEQALTREVEGGHHKIKFKTL